MGASAWLYNPVVIGLIALALIASVWLLRRMRRRRAMPAPYACRRAVLNAAERTLLATLLEAAGDRAIVLPRVPVRDALVPLPSLGRGAHRRALARLGTLRFDFLLCAPDDSRPLAAIVLDATPAKRRGQAARFVDAACGAAGLGLLRLDPNEHHSAGALDEALRPWLEPTPPDARADPLLEGRREPILDLPEDD